MTDTDDVVELSTEPEDLKPKKPSKTTLDAFDNLLKGSKSDGESKGERDGNVNDLKGPSLRSVIIT